MKTITKSAVTGRIVSPKEAKVNPRETVTMEVPKGKRHEGLEGLFNKDGTLVFCDLSAEFDKPQQYSKDTNREYYERQGYTLRRVIIEEVAE